MTTLIEHRRAPRVDVQGRVEIEPRASNSRLAPAGRSTRKPALAASSVNLSEGGICVRLEEMLELHARVTLRMFVERAQKPLQCAGQVTWVVQRLDLRTTPPFLYDVGFRFLNPSGRLRHWVSRTGVGRRPAAGRAASGWLQPATVRGRGYAPSLEKESSARMPWHLVVRRGG
ncbi:MAG: PilZ domain-containing protein [Candidatus Omnitrophica bacterium]|nr:PilZ domain-containing protein [Candidatus Omnitrophota bacterium]